MNRWIVYLLNCVWPGAVATACFVLVPLYVENLLVIVIAIAMGLFYAGYLGVLTFFFVMDLRTSVRAKREPTSEKHGG